MKICIDAREFIGKRRTGIGRHVENLFLPLLSDARAELLFFTHDPLLLPETLRSAGAQTVTIPKAPTLVADQLLLPRLAGQAGADIFFSPYYKTPLTGPFLKFITVHDIMFLKLPETPAWKRAVSELQLRLAAARADIIFVDSEFTGMELRELIPRVEPKVKTLYPNLEPFWATPPDRDTVEKTRQKFAGGKKFIMYVGNFKPHKNVKLLVETFLRMAANKDNKNRLLLLVGGDPKHLPSIENILRHSSRSDAVRIHSGIDDEELRALYHGADWTTTLSEYEGFGYPVIEAMACACPVICFPCTSLAEITESCALHITGLTETCVYETITAALEMETGEREKLIAHGSANARIFLSGTSARQLLDHAMNFRVGTPV